MVMYTVTIEPTEGFCPGGAKAVLHVELGSAGADIVEMAFTATVSGGFMNDDESAIAWREVFGALGASVQPRQSGQSTPIRNSPDVLVHADDGDVQVRSRAYRRMPDADELRAAFDRIGTVTGLAKHYGVPRHTAQGWMARLRRSGAVQKTTLNTASDNESGAS